MDKLKKHGPVVARTLLGLVYLMAGIVGLLQLAPPPADLPQGMLDFHKALEGTNHFFPLLKATETVCGLLLIIAVAPALSLVILAPITINIFFVHLILTPGVQNHPRLWLAFYSAEGRTLYRSSSNALQV